MTEAERTILLNYLCNGKYASLADTSPADEGKCFCECPDCGGWIDLSRLVDLLDHVEPGHQAAPVH